MSGNLQRVSRKHPCHVCGRPDWCYYTDSTAFCTRVAAGSFRQTRDGVYMHRIELPRHMAQARRERTPGTTRASVEHVAAVYFSLLQCLGLSESHREGLCRRGLDEHTIEKNGYVSTPTAREAVAIVRELQPLGLRGVPGFYQVDDRWCIVGTPPGIVINVRNAKQQICGLQIRRDHVWDGGNYLWLSSANRPYGSSSGAPLHWARPDLLAESTEVLLTEGALKADVISHFLAVPIIAAAGVGLFGRSFGAQLKANYPNIAAVICFDSDWRTKPHVKTALIALQRQLTAAGVPWRVRCWPTEFKGYDDFLLSIFQTEVAA